MKKLGLREYKEGECIFLEYLEDVPSKKQKVFFNVNKKLDRDISCIFAKSYFENKFIFLDFMCASGIRGIRIYKESLGRCERIILNDISKDAINLAKINCKKNNVENFIILNEDCNKLQYIIDEKVDWIDIDPFGSPIPYISSALKIIKPNGIISITATDCGNLSGKFHKKTFSNYGIITKKNSAMHEIGIRNLIKKAIDISVWEEKILIPIFSHATLHYYRVYFIVKRVGRSKIYEYLDKNVGIIKIYKGIPYKSYTLEEFERKSIKVDKEDIFFTYVGKLWDENLIKKMLENSRKNSESYKLLKITLEESKINIPYYYDIHYIRSLFKIGESKKMSEIIDAIKEKGYSATRTHFSTTGVRSNISLNELIKIIKK